MEKEQLKIAFQKVKQDISNLENKISDLNKELYEIKELIRQFYDTLNSLKYEKNLPTDPQTIRQINPTVSVIPTDNPTVPQELKGLKDPNLTISTRNGGVPTDRQSDSQTVRQTQERPLNIEKNILEASEILNSLDRLKKEIRQKFKILTDQEMLIFSTIYQFEEKDPQNTTYRQIAHSLMLSESSIRDYVQKLIYKGIPIKKQKINNRKVILSISSELRKIASLSTIIQLREL